MKNRALLLETYDIFCHLFIVVHDLPMIFFVVVMGKHLIIHGDGVKDVAFEVEDCIALYKVTCRM